MQGDEADGGGGPASASTTDDGVTGMCWKPSKGKNIRKRTALEEGEGNDEDSKVESSVVFNKKKQAAADNKLHFSSGPLKHSKESEVEKPKASVFEYEERVLKQAEEALKGKKKGDGEDKLYKGLHGYTDYKAGFRREQTVASEKAGGSHGPLRASAHIRVSARFDYQPDICKDYKETGYVLWEPFVDPVVTKCKHYFCEHCALKHHARNKKCFVCNQPTNGIFNTAFEIRKRMAAERK
ncbi:UNVERIFIED_CONTAM: Zinc finger CCCH domain-containing protein 1 [Sesamum latifolium]|uniref:Zinc finger CCCH domain-containing protein 1 n=1 Tax=Sesamum latifolium TaxID=2727402 RepID=A0AAW2YGN7_9LAMI